MRDLNTIYLSAQPDEIYFLWQLKLQIFNFKKIGIPKENIHVLIGYQKSNGLNVEFQRFIDSNEDASFYIYEDTRIRKKYTPSLRPNIICKHFIKYPYLEGMTIFYHDSDIIFRHMPDWIDFLHDDLWYASNVRSYVGCDCIINAVGREVFEDMCRIVDVDCESVILNDKNTGGAQFILKQVPVSFWKKVEQDCENLYAYLLERTKSDNFFNDLKDSSNFQVWCVDMWIHWWNAIKMGKVFKIVEEMNFCWADSKLEEWNKCNILHYTGKMNEYNQNGKYFRKKNYVHFEPFYDDFSNIDENTCSVPLISLIHEYQKELNKDRISLTDVSFLILLENGNEKSTRQALSVVKYLVRYFTTSIRLLEVNTTQYVDECLLPQEVKYDYIAIQSNVNSEKEEYINYLIDSSYTPYLCIYDPSLVIPTDQILKSVTLLRNNTVSVSIPYNQPIAYVDIMATYLFPKIIDEKFLTVNMGKTIFRNDKLEIKSVFFSKGSHCKNGSELFSVGSNHIDQKENLSKLHFSEGLAFQLHSV